MALRTGFGNMGAAGERESSAEADGESLAAWEGPCYRRMSCINRRRSCSGQETCTEPGVLMSDIVQNVP